MQRETKATSVNGTIRDQHSEKEREIADNLQCVHRAFEAVPSDYPAERFPERLASPGNRAAASLVRRERPAHLPLHRRTPSGVPTNNSGQTTSEKRMVDPPRKLRRNNPDASEGKRVLADGKKKGKETNTADCDQMNLQRSIGLGSK